MTLHTFDLFCALMALIALFVFIALYFVKAGYGIFRTSTWGFSINNRWAWMFMESPVFIVMLLLWMGSDRRFYSTELVLFLLFQLHYFHRSFIFPLMLQGNSKMPIAIMIMGILFNLLNGYMQGEWLFYLAPVKVYSDTLFQWHFWFGLVLFFIGMIINIHSDYIIRNLRKPDDTQHYLPQKGFYKYVTSANYFGEIVEWTGWAVMTLSLSGIVFLWWTFANLVPRANAIWHRYKEEFGSEVGARKRIFPYIY